MTSLHHWNRKWNQNTGNATKNEYTDEIWSRSFNIDLLWSWRLWNRELVESAVEITWSPSSGSKYSSSEKSSSASGLSCSSKLNTPAIPLHLWIHFFNFCPVNHFISPWNITFLTHDVKEGFLVMSQNHVICNLTNRRTCYTHPRKRIISIGFRPHVRFGPQRSLRHHVWTQTPLFCVSIMNYNHHGKKYNIDLFAFNLRSMNAWNFPPIY